MLKQIVSHGKLEPPYKKLLTTDRCSPKPHTPSLQLPDLIVDLLGFRRGRRKPRRYRRRPAVGPPETLDAFAASASAKRGWPVPTGPWKPKSQDVFWHLLAPSCTQRELLNGARSSVVEAQALVPLLVFQDHGLLTKRKNRTRSIRGSTTSTRDQTLDRTPWSWKEPWKFIKLRTPKKFMWPVFEEEPPPHAMFPTPLLALACCLWERWDAGSLFSTAGSLFCDHGHPRRPQAQLSRAWYKATWDALP